MPVASALAGLVHSRSTLPSSSRRRPQLQRPTTNPFAQHRNPALAQPIMASGYGLNGGECARPSQPPQWLPSDPIPTTYSQPPRSLPVLSLLAGAARMLRRQYQLGGRLGQEEVRAGSRGLLRVPPPQEGGGHSMLEYLGPDDLMANLLPHTGCESQDSAGGIPEGRGAWNQRGLPDGWPNTGSRLIGEPRSEIGRRSGRGNTPLALHVYFLHPEHHRGSEMQGAVLNGGWIAMCSQCVYSLMASAHVSIRLIPSKLFAFPCAQISA